MRAHRREMRTRGRGDARRPGGRPPLNRRGREAGPDDHGPGMPAGMSVKARKAAAVVISKKVIGAPALAASQRSRQAASRSSAMGAPSRRMRSLKRTRWGEM